MRNYMKGLLIKDFMLLKNQKSSLLIVAVIAVAMTAYLENTSFLIAYLAFIGSQFARNTISYDDFDNGNAFLFSLPVTRKSYAAEKYAFGLLVGVGGWLFGSGAAIIAGMVKGTVSPVDTLMIALLTFPMLLVFIAISVPFHLKFGAEKSSIAMIVIGFLLAAVFMLAARLTKAANHDLTALTDMLPAMNTTSAVLAGFIAGTVILLISLWVSIGIMQKKEF